MPNRKRFRLSKMVYDEVSLVDSGANQHAHVLIYKRDDSGDIAKGNDNRLQQAPKLGTPSQRNPTAFRGRTGSRGMGAAGARSNSGRGGSGSSNSAAAAQKKAAAAQAAAAKKTAAANKAAAAAAAKKNSAAAKAAAAHQRALAAHARAVARTAKNHAKSAGKHKVGLGRGKGFKWVDDSPGVAGIAQMSTTTLHKSDTGGTWLITKQDKTEPSGTWVITKSILTPADVHNDSPLGAIQTGPRTQRVGGPQKIPGKKDHHAKRQLRHYNGKWVPTGPHVNGTSKTPAVRVTQ
jgi:hypothetical protein